MSEKNVVAAAASGSESHISRRDGLKLVAGAMATSLLTAHVSGRGTTRIITTHAP